MRVTHVFVLYGPAAAADHQHQHGGAEEEYDGEVEVVDAAQQERAGGREDAAARTEPELGQHAAQTHQQAAYQAPERTLEGSGGGGKQSSCVHLDDLL